MKSEIIAAINQLCSEKGLSSEVVFEAVEAALLSAYRRSERGSGVVGQDISVHMDRETGQFDIRRHCQVVEEVSDPRIELTLAEAQAIDPAVELGGEIVTQIPASQDFGRIAAQTAKQVILQRIREAERESLYSEYMNRAGDIVHGTVYRVEPRGVIISLGKAEALMPPPEQIPREYYRIGQRIRAFVLEVRRANRGPQVVVSRTHPDLVRRLIELEVPEVFAGTVEIKSIAREPGARSKVAVAAREPGVDPVGACVGIRGVRVQNVVAELNGEKVDIVAWNPDPGVLVANALSPARVTSVTVVEDENTTIVVVPDDQLSLAIGRAGQNARLAARLTGWRIDIKSVSEAQEDEGWIALDGEESLESIREDLAPGEYEEIIEYIEEAPVARAVPAELPEDEDLTDLAPVIEVPEEELVELAVEPPALEVPPIASALLVEPVYDAEEEPSEEGEVRTQDRQKEAKKGRRDRRRRADTFVVEEPDW
ncbi:MAG: transcription termination factor NusA [Chloroflexi bacterium]|nr:transcription termination factor NusA [Chloroflexota bacterium]MBU1747032.1 transcription termination factor NusA [Chloroflexota bacterium]